MNLQITGNNMNGSPELSLSGGNCNTFSWSPFGGGGPRNGSAPSLPGFNGERQDPLSGVTHLGNGYRAYSPALRRFTCPDSESPFGEGGINPYVYCNHDPINNTDPSGHMPKKTAAVMEAEIRARRAALEARNAQVEAQHVAIQPPIQRPHPATGNEPELAQRRAAPAAPVQGAPHQRQRRGAINEHPASTSGQVNPSNFGAIQPAPLPMLKAKALEDQFKIRTNVFVNYQDSDFDFRITINNGKLYYGRNLLTTNPRGDFKFIQSDSNKLYGVETYLNPNGIKHSSILRKKWPISAGKMVVENGKLHAISNSSGHFYPGEENLNYTISYLKSVGVEAKHKELIPTPGRPERLRETVQEYKTKYVNFRR